MLSPILTDEIFDITPVVIYKGNEYYFPPSAFAFSIRDITAWTDRT